MISRSITIASSLALFLLLLPVNASAALYSWTGATGTPLWSNQYNWTPTSVPVYYRDVIVFPAWTVHRGPVTNDLVGGQFDTMNFDGDGYVVNGNALIIGTIGGSNSTPITINAPIQVSSALQQNLIFNGPLTLAGTIFVAANWTVTANGAVTGTGGLNVNGTAFLNGATSYTGGTTVSGLFVASGTIGTLQVSGATASASPGTSSSSGVLNTGYLALSSGRLEFLLNGTVAGTGYDQINVTGGVNLNAASGNLSVILGSGFIPSVGQAFVLIQNDGADAVVGTFKDLPEGSTVLVGVYPFFLTYGGGNGNDVALISTIGLMQSTTSVTTSNGYAATNEAVTLTSTVTAASGTPTGSVSFRIGTTLLGTSTLSNGTAAFTSSTIPVGTHSIVATYSGDSAFALSSGNVSQIVRAANPPPSDVNGDGNADIVWRNYTTGDNAIWYMSGSAVMSSATLPAVVDTSFRIVAVRDFDGDGRSDLLFRSNVTGDNFIILMNGMSVGSTVSLPPVPLPNWGIERVGDFGGDGKAYILWRNTLTGDNAMWCVSGGVLVSSAALPAVSFPWIIAGTGDFDGDGKDDIFWHNKNSNDNSIWFMNGT
ncbi:MAG: Ig-like domain repeat protein, partial [Thermoanaerobaculia bacterium]